MSGPRLVCLGPLFFVFVRGLRPAGWRVVIDGGAVRLTFLGRRQRFAIPGCLAPYAPGSMPSCAIIPATSGWALNEAILPS